MTAKIIKFKPKAETTEGRYMGFDSLKELLQVVESSPNNADWFKRNHKKFGKDSRIEVVENTTQMYSSLEKFLVLNHVTAKGANGIGVFEIEPHTYMLQFVGVFDSAGNNIDKQIWTTKKV